MARKYTSKETKMLIDAHKDNIKHLEASVSLPSKYAGQIQRCVNNMLSGDVFTNTVMNALKGNGSDEEASTGELIRLVYLFKRATQQSNTCNYILLDNRERIINIPMQPIQIPNLEIPADNDKK